MEGGVVSGHVFHQYVEAIGSAVEEDVKKIEKRLEELGAPMTPGRLPR